MYLLGAKHRDGSWIFKIEGFSGSKYKVWMHKEKGCKCECIDFRNRSSHCKHIYFIFCRVMGRPAWARTISAHPVEKSAFDLFPDLTERLTAVLTKRSEASTQDDTDANGVRCNANRIVARNSECIICFEPFSEARPGDWLCDNGGCGNALHMTCIKTYARHLQRMQFPCPLCRKLCRFGKRPRDESDSNKDGMAKFARTEAEQGV
jgi:hypothetical protein